MIVLDVGLLISIAVGGVAVFLFYQTMGALRASKKYIDLQAKALNDRDGMILRLTFELEKHGGSDDQLLIEEARELLGKTSLEGE